MTCPFLLLLPVQCLLAACTASAAGPEAPRYYAYAGVEDREGVIAPWYQGQNGQCDFRVRIAAETLKRYPWADSGKGASPAPEFVFNGHWQIATNGAITIPQLRDWDNGDLGQRAAYVLAALVDYYRYSGDAAAIALITLQADALLDHCETGPDHPWPNFLISVPTKGRPYGKCDPRGLIQLDIVAEAGLALVRAYELTGNRRWFEAAKNWAELLASHRNRAPGRSPWNRYANPEDASWNDQQTGGVVFILEFFDELMRAGYAPRSLREAREAGRNYLRDVLLPRWEVNDTWGRNYWDWEDPVQAENVTEFIVRYLIEHPEEFPNWRTDARNILSLFLNHTSVAPGSRGDVYSGAWAYPESSGCCGRSLWYGPMEMAMVFAQYGAAADSEWGREHGRRQMLLATYDAHETGVVEDNIDGGQIVAGAWFKIAHPMALKHVLGTLGWLPEALGASGENHIVRSASVVNSVVYERGKIDYSTFAAPLNSVDVLRLAFRPTAVRANGKKLSSRHELTASGYQLKELPGGDCLVFVRHDGSRSVQVEGDDPAAVAGADGMTFMGEWRAPSARERASSTAGANMAFTFAGNQVRLIGDVAPDGGLAEVYLDGEKQLAGIDCWNPARRNRQVLFYRNGLANAQHQLKIVVLGAKNPVSQGASVYLNEAQWSAVSRPRCFGEGGGPTNVQRVVLGYAGRCDYVDSAGQSWRPGTEFVIRSGNLADSVLSSWWVEPRRLTMGNTTDPELYCHGVHGRDFTVYFTVGPGRYHARLKFAETRSLPAAKRAVTIRINGKAVVTALDIAATAGGLNKAADLVFDNIAPQHGIVAINFTGTGDGEAIVQAIEVGPGSGGSGAKPVCVVTK